MLENEIVSFFFLRHPPEQGRGAPPHGPGRDAAQQAGLTANVYTDPKLLDAAGDIGSLPFLPLDPPARATARPTSTDATVGLPTRAIALPIALPSR